MCRVPCRSWQTRIQRSPLPFSLTPPPAFQGEDSSSESPVLAASTESATADDPAQVAAPAEGGQGAPPAGEPVAHTAAPPAGRQRAPPERRPGGLEGSEEAPRDGEGPQQVRQEVRVRQMLRIHTHADGSITEEVVSEQILQVSWR